MSRELTADVLILIVVDDGLVPTLSVTIERYEDGVLILIVVDDGLVQILSLLYNFTREKS